MSIFEPIASPWPARALALFRMVAALLFISSGTMKLFGFPQSVQPGMPVALFSLLGLAGVLETFGGLAILLGLFTRPVSFVLCGEMAVAYFWVHSPRSFFPTVNQGTPAVLYCFLYLYLFVAGPGACSLDGRIARGKRAAAGEFSA